MDIASGDVICIPPREIRPVHEPRDPELLSSLIRSRRRSGWLGRPLLVLREGSGIYQALTGSHRLSAAIQTELSTVPAIVAPPEVAEKIRSSRYFPKAPPFIAQDLFDAGAGWIGRFILMDQWLVGVKKPWSRDALEHLRALGHGDMIEVMSVRKWPCED